MITEPGVYDDLPDAEYHAHPALSHSGARNLLPPYTPAHFAHFREHRRASKPEYDFGHVAHKNVLGVGSEVVVIEEDNWQKKAAREARDAAYDAGKVPILAKDHQHAQEMVEVFRRNPLASMLIDPANGRSEVSAFYTDRKTGVQLRCRFDFLPTGKLKGKLRIADFKTTKSADAETFSKSAANYGYAMQGAWYIDAVIALGIDPDPTFVFINQERDAPYLISFTELSPDALRIGRGLNRQAIDLYAECLASGEWPGFPQHVQTVSLPPWFERQHEEFLL